MEKIELSKRLQQVAKFVKKDEVIVDIGSDHGYLPIYLVQKNLVPAAIAGEVVPGPYQKTKEEVALHHLTEKISTRLGSGFDVLEVGEEIGSAFICGMGGILISEIIEKGLHDQKIGRETRLILQPNNNEETLRKLLMKHQFQIEEESVLEENGKYYEIIVASPSIEDTKYSEVELLFGPKLLAEKSTVFQEKWQKTLENNEKIISNLDEESHQNKIDELRRMNTQIRKVIT